MKPKRTSDATELTFVLPLKNGRSVEVLANSSRASVRKLSPKESNGQDIVTVKIGAERNYKRQATLKLLEDLCKVIHATDFKVEMEEGLIRSPRLFELIAGYGLVEEGRQFLRSVQALREPLFPYIHQLSQAIASPNTMAKRESMTKLMLEFMDPSVDTKTWFEGGTSQYLVKMAQQLNSNGSYPYTNSRGYDIVLSYQHVECFKHLILGGFDASELMKLPLRADISSAFQSAIWSREQRMLSVFLPKATHARAGSAMRL